MIFIFFGSFSSVAQEMPIAILVNDKPFHVLTIQRYHVVDCQLHRQLNKKKANVRNYNTTDGSIFTCCRNCYSAGVAITSNDCAAFAESMTSLSCLTHTTAAAAM